MKIIIETVPADQCRNDECGDWHFEADGILRVYVAEMPWKSALAVGVHEAIEALLCQEAGITDLQVTQFDEQFNGERITGIHGAMEECGDSLNAPYHDQHVAATAAERMVCAALGITWKEHDINVYANI